jgi:hypothetical protein
MILVATILLGGCLSSAEKAEGKRNVNEAKPYLKQYVKDKYGKKAKISDYSYVTWTDIDSTVAKRDVGISSCVTAQIQTENDTFTIMYDLNTGNYSSDEYLAELKPELLRMFNEDIGFTGAFACDIDFQDEYLDVNRLLPVDIRPTNLEQLYENANYLEIMIYCNAGDWDENSFRGDDIRNKFGRIQWDENKGLSIYILNMYDKEKYDELKSQEYSEYMWFNSDNVVEFDGSSVSIPEESYIGTYASSAYLLWEYQEELLVYSIDEESIQQN